MSSPAIDQNPAYMHPVLTLGTSLSSLSPAPNNTSVAYIEMGVRLHRLEQDYLELHRRLTEHGIRLDALHTPKTTTGDGDDSRATLKRLVFESVTATHSLSPREPLGYDCVREQSKFPKLKFFTDRQWTNWKNNNKKTTRIGEEIVRGRKMSAQGINHTAPYIEYPNGTPASGDYINDARKFSRTLINLARGADYPLPRKWGDTDTWLQELFYTALRKKFPLFQLCHNNWKGNTFMYYTYYEAVTRKWDKASSQAVDLNQALHTIRSQSAMEESESESESERVAHVPTSKDARSLAPSKRTPSDDDADTGPRKQPRRDTAGLAQDVGPSEKFKGKQRATPSLLSVISTSTTALRLEQRSSALVTLPPSLPTPTSPSQSALAFARPSATTSPMSATTSPTSATTSPTSATTSTTSTTTSTTSVPVSLSVPGTSSDPAQMLIVPPVSSTTMNLTVGTPASPSEPSPASIPYPSTSKQATSTLSPTPINPDVPAEGGVDISASPPQHVTPPDTAPSNEQPSKPAETTASKKPRAPRKTTQWPPAPDLKGAKWVYARKWYADANGTLEAFEAHYKTLSSSDRRKLGRVAPA
ncbi:hypothetical protein DICSQDRAFT_165316 [Dichomitus squalens LYAD-421 SS1]|uniref:uncharacterized protein n=1 Tax=Dichomitus squalens (strain LYAD-421) TaxID=732165 RepID=UPI0004410A63|nr:uncharacterized protein DICSQDRAFT_165316 [Dichomitus squalens LYAD-421 SS1]EJF67492.1 hypothetical protein DICSQDRAFT_165316 [Dichomitus squalens LYAD-421 SS1]